MPTGPLYVGLISGTSVDAIDAVLVDFASGRAQLVAASAFPYPAPLRHALLDLAQGEGLTTLDQFGALDAQVALCFAAAAKRVRWVRPGMWPAGEKRSRSAPQRPGGPIGPPGRSRKPSRNCMI